MEQLINFKEAQIQALQKKVLLLEHENEKLTELVNYAKQMFNEIIEDYGSE